MLAKKLHQYRRNRNALLDCRSLSGRPRAASATFILIRERESARTRDAVRALVYIVYYNDRFSRDFLLRRVNYRSLLHYLRKIAVHKQHNLLPLNPDGKENNVHCVTIKIPSNRRKLDSLYVY